MKRFVQLNRTFLLYMGAGMALSLVTALVSSCSFVNSFSGNEFTVDSISFNTTALVLRQGSMDILSVAMEPANAQPQAQVSWDFDRSVIQATTDNYGMVLTGLRPGETIVRLTGYGKTATCVVTVLPGSADPAVPFPYVYSNIEVVEVRPGDTAKAAASLYGGTPSDINGFTFTIDKPAVASLTAEGNYVWITGQTEGIAQVTVRHAKAAYAFSFLVSCQADGRAVPYLTTPDTVVTINRSLERDASFTADLQNPPAAAYEGLVAWSLVDSGGAAPADPPVTLTATGNHVTVIPLRTGECYVRASHPDAPYPLDVLVRVIEHIDTVYIEPSSSLVKLSGTSSETLSVSLSNLPADVTPNVHDYQWSFPPDAADYLDWRVYGSGAGGGAAGSGDTVWLTAKQAGTVILSVSHPLASQPRDILIVIRNMTDTAASASTYISTSQNYVSARVGDGDIPIAIYINNAAPGDETSLSWHIGHDAADGSGGPVIAWISGTGNAAGAARSAAPVASGHAVISPLREGRAVITVSHPKAVYDMKILVTVLPADTTAAAPFALATGTPYAAIKNGSVLDLAVTLQGIGKNPADEQDIQWLYNGRNLSIQANGASASVTALHTGTSRETLTVSHPKAAHPLAIAILRYDTEAERDSAKYLYAEHPYYVLSTGETAYLAVQAVNRSPADTLFWQITDGASHVSLAQTDTSNAALTALSPGSAAVTAALAGSGESVTFSITVKQDGIVHEGTPCYLTTNQNVIVLEPGGETDITVTPVNISESKYTEFQWSVSDASLVEIIPNGPKATARSRSGGGKALITVSHPLASNTLELHIHIGDVYEYKNTDVAYIDTPADTIFLRAGDEDTLLRPVLAHTEQPDLTTSGFSFAIRHPAIATVSWSSAAAGCFITPQSPGQTILTISHPEAACDKEVLVIVDRAEGDTGAVPYITTAHNVITVVSGDYATATVSLVNKASYDSAAWDWKVQDTRIAQVIVNNGSTAMIQGDLPGTTFVSVFHADSPYPLKLIIICLDAAVARSRPWITTSTNIAAVKTGSSVTLTADMVGGSETDHAGFLWSVSDSSVALLSSSGHTVSVRGMACGTAYLSVRNTRYPDSYA
jgi:hypothetical protein